MKNLEEFIATQRGEFNIIGSIEELLEITHLLENIGYADEGADRIVENNAFKKYKHIGVNIKKRNYWATNRIRKASVKAEEFLYMKIKFKTCKSL
jgi:hypothetical protein